MNNGHQGGILGFFFYLICKVKIFTLMSEIVKLYEIPPCFSIIEIIAKILKYKYDLHLTWLSRGNYQAIWMLDWEDTTCVWQLWHELLKS